MEKKSWVCTLITQLSLCFALFVVLNIGHPQKPTNQKRSERRPIDFYFITIRGGFRPLQEQTHFLIQVEKVVKTYKVKFVIDVSEFGEKDPLMQNATRYFQSFKLPWYPTRASKRQGAEYFLKKVKFLHGKTIDLIALDTCSLQDSKSGTGRDQLQWLSRTLKASNSSWHIVAGFHPIVACDENIEQTKTNRSFVSLRNMFLKYGVNVYLSGQACPNLVHKRHIMQISNQGPFNEGPCFTTIDQRMLFHKETVNGFFLHRVSSLELVTYFISLSGEAAHKIVLQPWGKEVM
ncbi:uncharacterized protein LOC130780380 isoform X2 [Actinidia eriantha]|uniref:uncharacterized protein LOC130780380 isoform X2 n=1 Tax=Actinidia eriantha TaxID=165200 RepID=UPI00258EEE26|nr:uncharacterized protein LOC130780380 isoform X2 [Actinidia eriantha]